jgi:hypothetical protein
LLDGADRVNGYQPLRTRCALKRLLKADIALSEVIAEFTDMDQSAYDLLVSAKLDVTRAREILTRATPSAVAEDEPPLGALPVATTKKVRRKRTPKQA